MKNAKRIGWPVYMAVGMMLAGCSGARAGVVFFPNPAGTTVTQGDTFNFTVMWESDNPNIFAFDLEVTFPAFLNAVSVTEQGFFGTNGVLGLSPTIDNVGGFVSTLYDAAGGPNTVIGDGSSTEPLLSILFLVVGTGSGSIGIECDNGNDCADFPMVSDGSFNPISVDFILPGSVTANALPPPPAVPEPASALLMFPALAVGVLLRRKAR